MIKKHMKLFIITSIVILLPILAGIILWDQLPNSIPVHWNFSGEVDRWTSKTSAVFFLPLLLLGIHWLCLVGTSLDPKRKNHSEKVILLLFWCIPVISVITHGFTYAFALGNNVKRDLVTLLLVGIVFTVVGNYLPKCKQNYTIGIKIPWTLDSEENWNRTHRFAGVVWTVGGIVLILSAFIEFKVFSIVAIFAIALAPVVYSYLLYRKGI